jgi:hypothetical protein
MPIRVLLVRGSCSAPVGSTPAFGVAVHDSRSGQPIGTAVRSLSGKRNPTGPDWPDWIE